MEKLKSIIPEGIKRMIEESGPDDLLSTCSALLNFCLQTPHFHKMIVELADADNALCGKNVEAALDLKRKGNSCFSKGDYATAVHFYSQALRVAPVGAQEMEKNLVSTLYVNRASSLYKMDKLVECIRDCNRTIAISPSYAKAWYRRGVTNAALGNDYQASCDLKVSGILEPSLSGKRRVERVLEETRVRCMSNSSSVVHQVGRSLSCTDEKLSVKLNIVHTPTKGKGLTLNTDVPEATLVHTEQPFAVIILKRFRDTHCHFCFNELPADVIPCPSCSIPVYCSQDCQLQAVGDIETNSPNSSKVHENIPDELKKHITEVTLMAKCKLDKNHFAEHRHECEGLNWPAVLPPDIVLAGRILMKMLYKGKHIADNLEALNALDLSHNYAQKTSEDKLEFHIYATVLLSCLQRSHGPEIQPDGCLVAQLVILIAQVKVNSMAVVRMKSTDLSLAHGESLGGGPSTSNLEQIRVGQAIYLSGSLFNHSCKPNVHAYFISRTLFVRSTKLVAAGCPLELSYGPQVGQWDLRDRQLRLYYDYSFECQCDGCVNLNVSDLLLNAFQCADTCCYGVVLEIGAAEYEKKRLKTLRSSPETLSSKHLKQQQAKASSKEDLNAMAYHMLTDESKQIIPGHCLMCGSHLDLEAARKTIEETRIPVSRLQDAIASDKLQLNTILDAVRSFKLLKSVLHKYNKQIAEVSDILSQAYCMIGDSQAAIDYCKTSIEILEKLYETDHIAIAYELWKLSSIQMAHGDDMYMESLKRVSCILSRHYGSHIDMIFPQLKPLTQQLLLMRTW
ncbi:unnamed protein product [Rhodiola kirilowii]